MLAGRNIPYLVPIDWPIDIPIDTGLTSIEEGFGDLDFYRNDVYMPPMDDASFGTGAFYCSGIS